MVTEPTDTGVRDVDVIVVRRSTVPRNVATVSRTAPMDAGFAVVSVSLLASQLKLYGLSYFK